MEITGKVIENANYRSLPLVHPETLKGTQKGKTNVTVNGMTIVADNNGAETLWYRCALADGDFWIRNDLIHLTDPAAIDQLPFVTAAEIPNPKKLPFKVVKRSTDTVLQEVGVTLAPGEVMDGEQVKRVISALRRYGTRLRSTWTATDLQEVISMLDKLASLGVVLHGMEGGGWRMDEIRLIYRAIEKVASSTAGHFQRLFNVTDDLSDVAFRLMYGPLRIVRSPNNNINPNPRPDPKTGKVPIWWARNSQGFEVILGNMVFSGTSTKFKPEELVVHEIAHHLNFRYLPQKKRLHEFYRSTGSYTIPAEETFDGKAVKVSLGTLDEGYSTRPRSSDLAAEVVTDAFTNDIVNGYKDSVKGEARRSQVRALMRLAIETRLRDYGPARARVQAEKDKALEGRLAIPLARLDETEPAELKTFADQLTA
jgi:hypothetical protein